MAIVTGDRYLEKLVKFVEREAGGLIDGSLILKLNPAGLHYVQLRLEALHELESLLAGAPVDYLRAYVSDLGDHRALEQLRRILRLLTSLKVVSVLPSPLRDPTPLSLLPFGRLRVLELRGCDLSTSAAKGLLELRHTLEKIICHNSTDALRHVFASRIADIKDSPQWNRLSFVSCACNHLVLMDESLQLLPAVETLDLSRNKIEKVDNLRRCSKLKHLDLGFNHLRTIAPFSEVSCHIVKLVLRSNALTTLGGLENSKSLEGLDVSYNMISNFSELEFLSLLPSLHNLWLEGNPLCCARWYRAQVFSYFAYPDTLKLDDKEISRREFWKRRIVIASRQKQPASYGFYSPAKHGAEGEENRNRKKKKISRLAPIECEEDSSYFSSDQESLSCDNEVQSKEENIISDDDAEIVDLINKVEFMKKERSILWLREFKEWMDHEYDGSADGSACNTFHHIKENCAKNKMIQNHHNSSSRHSLHSFQLSEDDTSLNFLETKNSTKDISSGSHHGVTLPGMGRVNLRQKYQKLYSHESIGGRFLQAKYPNLDSFTIQGGHAVRENGTISALTIIDDTTDSHSSSAYPRSPPHYQEDILHRRHYLVEESLQLSAETFSMASSDSDTSSSDGNMNEDQSNEEYLNHDAESSTAKLPNSHYENASTVSHDGEISSFIKPGYTCLDDKKTNRKARRRVVSLSEETFNETSRLENSNCNMNNSNADAESEGGTQMVKGRDLLAVSDTTKMRSGVTSNKQNAGDFIVTYFNSNVADAKLNEICQHYVLCDCVLDTEYSCQEREIALLLSSENRVYVFLLGFALYEPEGIISLLCWHSVGDVREIIVGVGFQVVRLCINEGATYLLLTRSIENSRQLLHTLQFFDPGARFNNCLLRSLEQVQVDLFEKQICGGAKVSIFQYCMVRVQNSENEEAPWGLRSLFVSGEYVLLCIENIKHFSCPSMDASAPPYFILDSCCSIYDVSELMVDAVDRCLTLVLTHGTTKFCPYGAQENVRRTDEKNATSGSLTWKIKWFSEDSLFNFVALVKAIHSGTTESSLLITSMS
ncbi:hypothetical protein K2173_007071 [Erythroxylum novogranatense]|uniref:Uncharacterized protein n=1 Tax=Erythroxylum novogranatense TaxID=1862640 RepID=A0AAV8SL81_9ROSI|nr:hypothetical protein K2173_007071 [Erythroxylum novogranatense]